MNFDFYRTLIDELPLWQSCVNLEGIYLLASKYYIDNYKMALDQIEGHSLKDVLPLEKYEKYKQLIDECISSKKVIHYTDEYVDNEGNSSHIYGMFAPIYDSENKIYCVVGTAFDISKVKEIELALIAAKEKSDVSDPLRSAFLKKMLLEIRTPMNSIIGFSGLLSAAVLSDDQRLEYTSIIKKSCNQLLSIINGILTISSIETVFEEVGIQKVNINKTITELLTGFKDQVEQKGLSVVLNLSLTDKQSEILSDRAKLTQILTNLISNALKYTIKGAIEIGYTLNQSDLVFCVKDSGVGIKKDILDKIFDHLWLLDSAIGKNPNKAKFGLPISKALVELLGGKIWVESELNHGAAFYFTLPYKPVVEVQDSSGPSMSMHHNSTIIVADDEEFNFELIKELLQEFPFDIVHAVNGRETVDICRANPNIDLILMDIKMPYMSGDEATRQIKVFRPNLPIIAQTAYVLESDLIKYSGIFDDYITKPIKKSKLIETLKKYVGDIDE